MSTPRRRLIRPALLTTALSPQRQRRLQRLRTYLERERTLLARWMSKLTRAFHTVEKTQRRILRLERTLANQED
jgi:hypothetical protein